MQTIEALLITKIMKIVEETLSHFIPFSLMLGMSKVAQELIQLCIKAIIIAPIKEQGLILSPH
ncbi:MAG: hypothetical protein RCG15_08885 [Candidatus Rickettsia vulgarisii]